MWIHSPDKRQQPCRKCPLNVGWWISSDYESGGGLFQIESPPSPRLGYWSQLSGRDSGPPVTWAWLRASQHNPQSWAWIISGAQRKPHLQLKCKAQCTSESASVAEVDLFNCSFIVWFQRFPATFVHLTLDCTLGQEEVFLHRHTERGESANAAKTARNLEQLSSHKVIKRVRLSLLLSRFRVVHEQHKHSFSFRHTLWISLDFPHSASLDAK